MKKDKCIEIKFNDSTLNFWSGKEIESFARFLARMNGIEGIVYREETEDGSFQMRVK